MKPLAAALLLAVLIGPGVAVGEGDSKSLPPLPSSPYPSIERNTVEGVRAWMEYVGGLRFAPAEGERGCPNRLALQLSLGWGEDGIAAFADYRETGSEAQRLIAGLAVDGSDALRPFCFSSHPCLRDFARGHYAIRLAGRAKTEGLVATPPEQEAIVAALRSAEQPISPIGSIGEAKWVDDFAVAVVDRPGSGCESAEILWRDGETLRPFGSALLKCH